MFGNLKIFGIYLDGKRIDTLNYSEWSKATEETIKKELVEKDGYSPDIIVKRETEEEQEDDEDRPMSETEYFEENE